MSALFLFVDWVCIFAFFALIVELAHAVADRVRR